MDDLSSDPEQEARRLRRCMLDLVSVLALPAVWSSEPGRVLETLLDALLAMLDLDFLYGKINLELEKEPAELLRMAQLGAIGAGREDILLMLNRWFGQGHHRWSAERRRRWGDTEISILPLPLGIGGDFGFLVAGSRRASFPEDTERLTLCVAANQAAIGLQHALRLHEQKRVAGELDRQVAERTKKLAEINEALQLQVGLLQNLPVSAWTLKPDGTPDFVNQVWLEFSGQTLEFIRSHPEAWMTAIHPDDREAALQIFWEGVRSGQNFAFETRSLRAGDGTFRWHLQQAVVVRDAEGKVLKFIGTTTDIDDQKRAQEAVRASEANLRRVIDTIPTLSWCNLPDGPNEFLSMSWHEYTGLPAEDSHGWGWAASFHPEDLPPLMKRWQEMLITGESGEIEARIRRHDGVYRWFLIRASPFRDETGAILRWYGTSTDIEDRKRAEEALRVNEATLRGVFDNMPGLVSTLGPHGETELINGQILDYCGKTLEELKNWRVSDAIHPDDLPAIVALHTRSIQMGVSFESEYRLRRADGVYRWFQFRAEIVRDASGSINGWYVLATDIHDRKLAEEAVQASERSFASIINTIPTLAWSAWPDGYCDFLSKGWLDFTGLPLEKAQGWGWSDAIHPDDRDHLVQSWRTALGSGIPVDTEARLRRFDGAYRWTMVRGNPWLDASGSIVKWYGTNTDIEDRRRAEDELRRSEARHRVVVETASDAVISISESGEIILANPATKQIFGYDPEELIGKPLTLLMPEGARQLHDAGYKRYLETGVRHLNWRGTELTARRANGEEFPVGVSFGEVTAEGQRVFTGFIRDISERKRAEQALLASEQSLRLIVDGIAGLVAIMSPEGEIEGVNRQVLTYFGKTVENLKGWSTSDAVHPDDLPAVVASWTRSVETSCDYDVDHRLRRADGEYRWFHARGLPLRDADGRVIRWYVLLTDIHDRRQAEEALTRAREELARVTRVTSLGVLTASIAHEVNQPLSGIMTNAGTCLRMLNSDPANIEGARETARRTIRDANRASDVVTRLRALFRKRDVATDWVDLSDAAREVIALSLGELQANRIVLIDELADDLPLVKGDRIQIQQVILNLLRNASDAMSAVADRPRHLHIRTETEAAGHVRLTVRDSGVGFDSAIGDRLFESFYTTKDDGMGIGLSVSRSIIEAHEGRLWAARNDGPGATFAFSLPRVRGEQASAVQQ